MRRHIENGMVKHDGTCTRCREQFGERDTCTECGVYRHQVVRATRRRTIGGKRGRNSGRVKSQSK